MADARVLQVRLVQGGMLVLCVMLAACAAEPRTEAQRQINPQTSVDIRPPAAPYFSLQLASIVDEGEARAALGRYDNQPHARLERRGRFWALRIGAWSDRAEAQSAAADLKATGTSDAVVLYISNTVEWVTPARPAAASVPGRHPAAATTSTPAPPAKTAAPSPTLAELLAPADPFRESAAALHDEVHRQVATGQVARRDGWVHAIDVAPLMLYAARRGDLALYDGLRTQAQHLVHNDRKDPYTTGFVRWRVRDNTKPDVSAATEAMHLARALWVGAKRFGRAQDRTLALTIIDGYRRHAYELSGDWMVRKYFSFASRTFVNLSQITSYFPDFLADVERELGQSGGPTLSERSYGVIERAVTDIGLLYPLIQPEVNQAYPGLDLDVYAPNNVVGIADSCAAAEQSLQGRPEIAEDVLDFVDHEDHANRTDMIYAYVHAESGERVRRSVVPITVDACLVQLAARLGWNGLIKRLKPRLRLEIDTLAAAPQSQEAPLYVAGPLLLAAQALGAFGPN